MKTIKYISLVALLLVALTAKSQEAAVVNADSIPTDTIRTADFDVLELDSVASAQADSLAADSIEQETRKKGYHRFSIGARGGASALLHDVVNGNWICGGDVILDLQYAHYWPAKNKPLDLGIIAGIGLGYSQSGMRAAVDTAYTVTTDAGDIDYTLKADEVKEHDGQIQLEIPVMFSLIHENGLFFNVGPKFMLPVYTPYNQTIHNPDINAYFPEEGVNVSNEVVTGYVRDNQITTKGTDNGNQCKINIMLTAEIGYEWRFANGHSLGLGAFANYSVYNSFKNQGENKSLMDVTAPSASGSATVDILSATKTYAEGLGYFDAGVKLAYHFNFFPKPTVSAEKHEIYKDPSYLHIAVLDSLTRQPAKVNVAITTFDSTTIERSIADNYLLMRTHQGDYVVTAQDSLYYPNSATVSVSEDGVTDSVTLLMQPRPWFRLLVTHANTGEPLSTAVQLIAGDTLSLHTDSLGLLRSMLCDTLQYRVVIARTGYEPCEAAIANIGDSMHLQLKPVEVGKKVVLRNLNFANNKTKILESSEPALDDLYQFLADNPDVKIRITGHTDNVGADKFNQRLSEGRAKAVKDEIVKRGIDPSRIVADGKGKREPIDTNTTEEGRARNRRVEFFITSTGGKKIEQIKAH